MRGPVLVRGFDSSPFHLFGALGVGSGPFSYFGGVPLGPHDFPYYIIIPLVWLCCAVYLFLSPCVWVWDAAYGCGLRLSLGWGSA